MKYLGIKEHYIHNLNSLEKKYVFSRAFRKRKDCSKCWHYENLGEVYLGIQRILAAFLKVWNTFDDFMVWIHTLLYNIQIKKLSIQNSMMEWHWKKWQQKFILILRMILYFYCNHYCISHNKVPAWVFANLVKPGLCLSDVMI